MSDTTEAAVKRAISAAPELSDILEHVAEAVGAEERQPAVRFAELFFSKASAPFLRSRPPEVLARLAAGAFRFLGTASPDRVDVQVLNPDAENEGWYAPVTVIRTNVAERPFVVDSLREYLHSEDRSIESYIYPVLNVSRTPDGRVYDVGPSTAGSDRESIIHCEIARITDQETLETLEHEIARRLRDVVRATDDFAAMVDAVNRTIDSLSETERAVPERRVEIEETRAFLRWLRDGGFVFLGVREYDVVSTAEGGRAVRVAPSSGLGILRDETQSSFADPVPLEDLPESIRALVENGPLLIISKTNAESTVHRRARMDYIGVKRIDGAGIVVGEDRFIGLFTSKAFSEDAENIPILRTKLEQILDTAGAQKGSHDYKEIITIFNTMPKEELFLTSASEVGDEIQTVLVTYHTHEVRVTVRPGPLGRGASVMVILPKEKFSGEVRRAIEAALVERFGGQVLNYHLALGSGDQARLHFYVAADSDVVAAVRPDELEALARELIRDWTDQVHAGLERVRPPAEARRLATWYGKAFSGEYQAANAPEAAVLDILELEAMKREDRRVAIVFSNPLWPEELETAQRTTTLRLFLRDEKLVLSDFMPILENCGLRVVAVTPFATATDDERSSVIYAFEVQGPGREPLDVRECGSLLSEAVLAVRAGDATNDALNALVVLAGLAWRQVDVLRAYATYAFQIQAVPSRQSLPLALRKYPDIAHLLFRLFKAAFDPDGGATPEERAGTVRAIREDFESAMADVDLLVDDRALRALFTLIGATVRTNYYRHGGRAGSGRSGGVPYISLKFDCRKMRGLVRHRLLYEVWVRSARMEGVHLRGSKVARGGIRHSDRPDDFRTEILGLVRTQMVKNAVIVPAGSKGGFITLRSFDGREEQADEAAEQYRTLIRGLLDLTDNLVDGEPVAPESVFCYDEPDPYLVVAADKGTATFSDVANAVAGEYDFWLGDAFASGGSQGYDHKDVAITARGAWECVRRHFREKGKDIQSQPFTVVGIGDMSGDVFGNGMLLSPHIRLVAAFDHRHVFIDPDPDVATSFAERKRLFDLGRSSWADYDGSLLSKGGIILSRGAKQVDLSPEARAALGVLDDVGTLDGEELIRTVLRAPVELLWNGGIGTYVKASTESHADVGDPPNDRVRISATELRAQVVGEGGNLGLTQPARIEYALRGGRLNTDALDNSGGVDLSDREVNLKILLAPGVAAGRMSSDDRNSLLEELTDEVAAFVLADSGSQSMAVSLDELRARANPDDFRLLTTELEAQGYLDRADEGLPTWEVLAQRLDRNQSLMRPELAVLLSYAKIFVKQQVIASPLADDPATEGYLVHYFPTAAVRSTGREGARSHRLRREIVATQLTNDLVDLMGATFVHRVSKDTGREPAAVVRAWLISARLADHKSLLRAVDSTADLDAAVAYRWLLGLSRVLERATRWILGNVPEDQSISQLVDRNLERLSTLRRAFRSIVRGEDLRIFETRVEEIMRNGASEELARDLMTLRFLDHLLEILVIASDAGVPPEDAAMAYYRVSEVIRVAWLRTGIFAAAGDGSWDKRAAQALVSDVSRAHHHLTKTLLASSSEGSVEERAERFLTQHQRAFGRIDALVNEIEAEGAQSLAAMSVLGRELTALSARLEA